MGSYYNRAIEVVKKCANAIERHGQQLGILRDLEATRASDWLKDMAIEMRKACEDDVGEPGWHNWLSALLISHGLSKKAFDSTTANDLEMRKILEDALRKAFPSDPSS